MYSVLMFENTLLYQILRIQKDIIFFRLQFFPHCCYPNNSCDIFGKLLDAKKKIRQEAYFDKPKLIYPCSLNPIMELISYVYYSLFCI